MRGHANTRVARLGGISVPIWQPCIQSQMFCGCRHVSHSYIYIPCSPRGMGEIIKAGRWQRLWQRPQCTPLLNVFERRMREKNKVYFCRHFQHLMTAVAGDRTLKTGTSPYHIIIVPCLCKNQNGFVFTCSLINESDC